MLTKYAHIKFLTFTHWYYHVIELQENGGTADVFIFYYILAE